MGNFKKTFKPVHKGLFTSLRIHVMGGQLYLIMKDSYLPNEKQGNINTVIAT